MVKRNNRNKKKFFVHKSSYLDQDVEIGQGTKIWHFSHISQGAKIGRNCTLGQNVFIGQGVRIGNKVKIQNNVSVYSGVTLKDGVFCGPSVVFTNVKQPRCFYPVNKNYEKTLVKKGATLGAGATIVCGVTIGKYSFVGAGSVVTKDISDFSLVYGNPAKAKGWMCECGQKLNFKTRSASCGRCLKRYKKYKKTVAKS